MSVMAAPSSGAPVASSAAVAASLSPRPAATVDDGVAAALRILLAGGTFVKYAMGRGAPSDRVIRYVDDDSASAPTSRGRMTWSDPKKQRGPFAASTSNLHATHATTNDASDKPGRASMIVSASGGFDKSLLLREVTDIYCFAAADTRILTDRGFLFLEQIEAIREANDHILFACVDSTTRQIIYQPGAIVHPATSPPHLLNFTDASCAPLWSPDSDDDDTDQKNSDRSGHISLRVTPNHRMYVQTVTCRGDFESAMHHDGHDVPPHLMPAEQLELGFECSCTEQQKRIDSTEEQKCLHGRSHIAMQCHAVGGVSPDAAHGVLSRDDTDETSPVVALGIQTHSELNAFVELYGQHVILCPALVCLCRIHSHRDGSASVCTQAIGSARVRSDTPSLFDRTPFVCTRTRTRCTSRIL